MSKELIVVSHIGTSVIDVIDSELKMLVKDIENKTKTKTVLAFSSKRAINKLAKKGVKIPYIDDVLANISDYSVVKVLPIHLIQGKDYNRIKELCKKVTDSTKIKVICIDLLINNAERQYSLIEVINNIIVERNKQVLFVGHGSENQDTDLYAEFIENYSQVKSNTKFITLKSDINSIITELSDEVVLFPLFTVRGHHIINDIFDKSDSICKQLVKNGRIVYRYNKGLLSSPEIRKLYLNLLEGAL